MPTIPERDVFFGAVVLALAFFIAGGWGPTERALGKFSIALQQAAVYFAPTITVPELRQTYTTAASAPVASVTLGHVNASKPVQILIVPGHEPSYGGTEYGSLKERDIVVGIADKLTTLLNQNPRFRVTIARDRDAWNPVLQEYFSSQWENIRAFRDAQKQQVRTYREGGLITHTLDQVHHNAADEAVALRLYGINKWATDNAIDITLHLHINDYPRSRMASPGKHTGFSVYVQDRQFGNGEASRILGEAIARRLNAYHATSTLQVESAGVVEDQQLIAVGSNNSVDNAAVLIEYGYIYEPQFGDPETRELAEYDYAYETYLALQDFFNDPVLKTYGSGALVAHEWGDAPERGETSPDAYALQSALHYLGFYPPEGEQFSVCGIFGRFGPCTERALKAFQAALGIETTGMVGPKTKAVLEEIFGR